MLWPLIDDLTSDLDRAHADADRLADTLRAVRPLLAGAPDAVADTIEDVLDRHDLAVRAR